MTHKLKPIGIIALLFIMVIATSYAIISFDMMYPEQPTIYLANQAIKNVGDLLAIYLHPRFLHADIPFFRPSGHYLIYQLITPFIGWHQTRLFILINLTFLALTGYFLIGIYRILFKPYQYGAWVAFSLYLMHPALSISKLTIMHFDYAYIFFMAWSFYLFLQCCQQKLQRYTLLMTSLLLYAIALTFKEPAIMLGPVMVCYLFLTRHNKKIIPATVLITLTSILLGLYLLASWPASNYGNRAFNLYFSLGTINAFLTDGIGLTHQYIANGILANPNQAWRTLVFPDAARWILWPLLWLSLLVFIISPYKKVMLFLFISSALFLVLPFCWGMAAPWHYSPTLLMLSLMMGFSLDYVCNNIPILTPKTAAVCYTVTLLAAIAAINVNQVNIDKYMALKDGPVSLGINRNAVLNPPDIKNKLNNDSVLVVEDSAIQNDYTVGNSAFPFLLTMQEGYYDNLDKKQRTYAIQFHHTYSGTLFRYAYLMPSLKEEVYPFRIENMDNVPNEILYTWLQHANNIFSVGYDEQGKWYDKTDLFKYHLMRVQNNRRLIINTYRSQPVTSINKKLTFTKTLLYPDEQLCAYTCDQDTQCKGFVFKHTMQGNHHVMQCGFYQSAYKVSDMACDHCVQYMKA